MLSGTDVGVEGVCGRADGQLLWSHWLGCRHDKTMKCRTRLFSVSLNRITFTSGISHTTMSITKQQQCSTNLCCMGAPHGILCPHGILDAVDLLLVAPTVHHGALLGVSQCSLQGLNSLSSRPKTFLQLWKLTTQICIVTNQLEGSYGGWGES